MSQFSNGLPGTVRAEEADDAAPVDAETDVVHRGQARAPVMGMWSTRDIALTEAQMTGSAAQVSGPWRYETVQGAGHWLQLEAPETVNHLLTGFLAS